MVFQCLICGCWICFAPGLRILVCGVALALGVLARPLALGWRVVLRGVVVARVPCAWSFSFLSLLRLLWSWWSWRLRRRWMRVLIPWYVFFSCYGVVDVRTICLGELFFCCIDHSGIGIWFCYWCDYYVCKGNTFSRESVNWWTHNVERWTAS